MGGRDHELVRGAGVDKILHTVRTDGITQDAASVICVSLLRLLLTTGLFEVDDFLVSEGCSFCTFWDGVASFAVVLDTDRGVELAVLDGVRLMVFEGVVVVDSAVCRFVGVPEGPRIDTVLLVRDLSRYP